MSSGIDKPQSIKIDSFQKKDSYKVRVYLLLILDYIIALPTKI